MSITVKRNFVASMDRESSQQLQMWFSEHFFAPKLAAQFVTPIVSATVDQIWREKNVLRTTFHSTFEMIQL